MRVALFNTKRYDREFFEQANRAHAHAITYLEPRLTIDTAPLAEGFDAVCVFVNDTVDAPVIHRLHEAGVGTIALRCAGFNNVDLQAAEQCGIRVVRVPAYSPYSVAEHTVGLMLALNRKLVRAFHRVREGNFALDGLIGFDMHGRTAGIIGTGQIGQVVLRILSGFGCRLLAYDIQENEDCRELGVEYVPLERLYAESDIISLHCPLVPATKYLIDRAAIAAMRPGVMLINTSRGAIVETQAAIEGLKQGRIGALGIDVYEEEANLFFEDLSDKLIQDDVFARLLTFPNVLITGHQAFLTEQALEAIAGITLENLACAARGEASGNEVDSGLIVGRKG